MSTHWYYILVNLGCLIVPLIFSFHPKLQFYKQWKAFGVATIIMMAIFIPWDMYFTSQGIWGFNSKYVSGLFLLNLPVEEWLFFICIPFACTYTWHCIKVLVDKVPFPAFFKSMAWAFAVISLVVAAAFMGRWYTFTAHLVCGLFLLYHLLILKSYYISRFMFVFTLILIPFIITNGILTGIRFWEYDFVNLQPNNITEKIVWYDNSHNLGVRIFSMPLDDVAYGLTMLLLVITVYEKLIKKPVVTQA
jgi:lycopene cyclase domain-containing protein